MTELLDEEDHLSEGFGATQSASNATFNDELLLEEDLLGPDDSLTHTASVSDRTAIATQTSNAQASDYRAGKIDPTLPPRKSDVQDVNYDVQLDFDEDIEETSPLPPDDTSSRDDRSLRRRRSESSIDDIFDDEPNDAERSRKEERTTRPSFRGDNSRRFHRKDEIVSSRQTRRTRPPPKAVERAPPLLSLPTSSSTLSSLTSMPSTFATHMLHTSMVNTSVSYASMINTSVPYANVVNTSVPPPPIPLAAARPLIPTPNIRSSAPVSDSEWLEGMEAFLRKISSRSPPRSRIRSPSPRRYSRSPSPRHRHERCGDRHSPSPRYSSAARSDERTALQERLWRQQAQEMGLDADDYVQKLREQEAQRELRLQQKYSRIARREKTPEGSLEEVKPKTKIIRLSRRAPESKRVDATEPSHERQSSMSTSRSGAKQGTVIYLNPAKKAALEQSTSLRLACVPKAPVLASDGSSRDDIGERVMTLQRKDDELMNKTGSARKAPQKTVTATVPKPTPTAVTRRVVLPPGSATVTERQNVSGQTKRHVVAIESNEKSTTKELPNIRITMNQTSGKTSVTVQSPISAPSAVRRSVTSTLSERINKHLKEKRATTTIVPTSVRAVPHVLQAAAEPKSVEQKEPPKWRAEVAAFISGYSPDTPVKKFEIIAKTIGPTKMVAEQSPGQVVVIYEDASNAAEFAKRYNGRTICGATLSVRIDAYYAKREKDEL